MENRLYPEEYRTIGVSRKPDYSRCCETVREAGSRWPRYFQCKRPRGYGPDNAYCKQHDPAAISSRRIKSEEKAKQAWQKRRIEISGATFLAALREIADGHNDPRALAAKAIAKFEK